MTRSVLKKKYVREKKELHDFSSQANYTDRATAACRRSLVRTFADRGCRVVSATNPYGR
jgi:predicted Ser/Thr protein kinase